LFGVRFEDGSSVAILDEAPDGTTTLQDAHDLDAAATIVDERLRFGALGAEFDADHLLCGYWFPGTEGEVCCRGYNVMKGYYKMPEQTAAVIDPDGWLHTGDLGTCDENGCYRITGRIKDIIIRGGENISPREIEDLLLPLPEIRDVQVVGAPDEKYGEIPVAFVILNDGRALAEEDIRDHVRQHLAAYKVPKYVFFVDEYPLTASGKIQKFKLRELSKALVEQRRAGPA
ncbi:MAG TPA: AMP-binding protein, partial [Kiritimatiellia bacterium]|nr:AMP-binding protein [Kiritimatiellia bacterium]